MSSNLIDLIDIEIIPKEITKIWWYHPHSAPAFPYPTLDIYRTTRELPCGDEVYNGFLDETRFEFFYEKISQSMQHFSASLAGKLSQGKCDMKGKSLR